MAKRRSSLPRPWYAEGLQFRCQPDCGACCTNHGNYAYVYLEEDDVDRMSSHLGLTVEELERRHTTVVEGDRVLRMDEPDCPFLDGSRCSIYEARPTQCSTFPFWPESMKSRASWERLRSFCPGIGEGQKVPLLTIQRQLAARSSE